MKLTHRWTAYLVAGNCAVLGFYGYLAVSRETESFARATERDTDIAGQTFLTLLKEVWREHGAEAALPLIDKANAQQSTFEFRWIPGDSSRKESSPNDSSRKESSPNDSSRKESSSNDIGATPTRFERSNGRLHAFVPFTPPGSEAGGTLCVSKALAVDERYVRESLYRLYAATAVSIALSSALAVALGRGLIGQPIDAILGKIARVGLGDLSVPMALDRADELGQLADAIDAMASSLQTAREKAEDEAVVRAAAERKLHHAERLATVGRLASGVAHELGTPLNVLLARTSLITKADVPESVRANAEIVREQVRRMSRTIRQLLDLARRDEPQLARADLREVVTRTLSVLEPLGAEKGVRLELGEAPPAAWARADASQIEQVITNLVTNAIHASQGRSAAVVVRLASVKTARPERGPSARDYWRISIKDRGVGISPEDRARIFEPFFTTKGVGEGTGLGLAIAQAIVAEHEGWITVESELGVGSEFAFYVPAEAAS